MAPFLNREDRGAWTTRVSAHEESKPGVWSLAGVPQACDHLLHDIDRKRGIVIGRMFAMPESKDALVKADSLPSTCRISRAERRA